MNKTGFIYITAFWNDTREEFGAKCLVGNGVSDHLDDDEIFYYFSAFENIIGNQGDFTVTAFEYEA